MNLNDLLRKHDIDPSTVLVLRHRPHEPGLRKVLPWLAAERPETFNPYQQTQSGPLEAVMQRMVGSGHVASFIGHRPGQALFVGLYAIGKARPLTGDQYWRVPAYHEMKAFGMRGFHETPERTHILWFDLQKTDFYAAWQGRLVIDWPPPERSWWRRSHRNEMAVVALLEEGALAAAMPEWHELALTWADLAVLPTTWQSALSHWRGIYFVFDESDHKGYVGSACGDTNILGRWRNYAASGHGGNALLQKRDPKHFRFSILQRVSPDMDAADVVRLEASWKQRLHTRRPFGLNEN